MSKRIIVIRSENGLPISFEEVKEFSNNVEFDAFIKEVQENGKEYQKLLKGKEKEREKEKSALNERLNAIESKLDKLTQYIYSILGVESEYEISEVLADGND